MSSLDAFNELYSDFVNDLERAFPDAESVKAFRAEFVAARESSARGPLEAFMKSMPRVDHPETRHLSSK
jgi:hypothetical protein